MMTGSFARRSRPARRAGPRPVRPPVRLVSLTGEVNGLGPDQWGGQRAGFSATAQISRRDFGIDISIPMDGGGVVVGDKVSVSLEIEAVLHK